DDILGSVFSFHLYNHHGYGAYICGEETALLESLEGKKGFPRFKPPFPASYGLYGKPTTINNTETFAAVPWILNHGGEAFLDLGRPNNGGTKIFSVSGDVERPGNFEVRLGTPFAKLLEMAGEVRSGRKLKACIPGGSSMPVLPGEIMMATDMDYDSIAKAGSMLGSGAVIIMDDTRCMVKSLLRLSYFYYEESCGQCTPCREGTGWLWRVVHRIEHGEGRNEDLDLLVSVSDNNAGRRRHEGVDALGCGGPGAEERDGVSAHQSSARLSDLRSGRRVSAAGSRGRLRTVGIALPGSEACCVSQGIGAARRSRGDDS